MELERQGALPAARPRRQVWTNGNFLALWLASACTSMAFSVYLLSESWFVVQRLDRESWIGIVMAATTVPRVLLMPFAGVLADRMRRSVLLFFSNGIRAVLIMLLVVLVFERSLSIWGLLGFALAFGALDGFYWPANGSMLPNIIDKDQLARGNSILQTTNQLCFLLGPALGGYLLKFISFEAAFAASSLFLFAAAAVVRLVRDDGSADAAERPPFFRQWKDGIAYIRSFRYLVVLMGVSMVVNLLFAGPLNAGLPVLVNRSLNGDVLALSYMEISIAVGMMAGSSIAGILNLKRRRALIALALIALLGVATALLSGIAAVWQGVGLMFAIGLFVAFSNNLTSTLIQQMVERDMMGRVQGVLSTASMGLVPVSYAIVSVLLSAGASISTVLLASGIGLFVYVLFILAAVKVVRSAG
jgi:DHA3 family macrolide efflux protein-like MFS transporter